MSSSGLSFLSHVDTPLLRGDVTPAGTLRYMISYMISEVYDIKLISYDIDVYDIIRL